MGREELRQEEAGGKDEKVKEEGEEAEHWVEKGREKV